MIYQFQTPEDYIANHNSVEIVRDFIAGMTDQYFVRMCPQDMVPKTQIHI